MIKIGFDISQLAHFGGVATYTQELATELAGIKDLEMVFFYSSLRRSYKGNLKNVKKFKLPPTFFEVLFNRLHNVPIERFLGPVDIFHSSDWVQPPSKAKKVTTYHDVIPLKFPQWSHPKIVEVHNRRLKLVEKEVDQIIAVSETTKKDLIEISGIAKEKITVIYEGVGDNFEIADRKEVEEFRKKYQLPQNFVLAIGGIGERRNIKAIKQASLDYKLIITRENLNISRSEMPLLYNAATVLLYPSLYEGFGLPILEAMACGCPVITSNLSSMPEVAGEAAILVNPKSVSQIKTQINNVMEDSKLREGLIKKGKKRVKLFSWKTAASKTADLYRRLASD